jgi:hypothetical protein
MDSITAIISTFFFGSEETPETVNQDKGGSGNAGCVIA